MHIVYDDTIFFETATMTNAYGKEVEVVMVGSTCIGPNVLIQVSTNAIHAHEVENYNIGEALSEGLAFKVNKAIKRLHIIQKAFADCD